MCFDSNNKNSFFDYFSDAHVLAFLAEMQAFFFYIDIYRALKQTG